MKIFFLTIIIMSQSSFGAHIVRDKTLLDAVKDGDFETVKKLFANDLADMSLVDKDGNTALMLAKQRGDKEIEKFLRYQDLCEQELFETQITRSIIYIAPLDDDLFNISYDDGCTYTGEIREDGTRNGFGIFWDVKAHQFLSGNWINDNLFGRTKIIRHEGDRCSPVIDEFLEWRANGSPLSIETSSPFDLSPSTYDQEDFFQSSDDLNSNDQSSRWSRK